MTSARFSIRKYMERGVSGSFGLKASGLVIGLASNILLARGMGTDEFGAYTFVITVIGLLGIPTLLGLPEFLVREVARYSVAREWGLLRGLLVRAHQVVLAVGLTVALGGAVVVIWSDAHFELAFLFALPLLLVNTVTAIGVSALRGLRRVVLGQLPQFLIRPLLFLGAVGAFWWSGAEFNVAGIVGLQFICSSIALVVSIAFLAKALPAEVKSAGSEFRTPGWLKGAAPFLFLGGASYVANQIDIVMLGALRGNADVGVYKVAVQGAQLVVFVLVAVNTTIGPLISELFHAGDMARLKRVAIVSARIALLGSVPVALVFFFFGRPLIEFVFGAGYGDASLPLAVLCLGQVINAGVGSVALILNMTGYERDSLNGMVVSAVVNVIFNAMLIPKFGIEGAAWATTISLVVWNVVLGTMVFKRLGFWVHA